jgi:ribonuclease PH
MITITIEQAENATEINYDGDISVLAKLPPSLVQYMITSISVTLMHQVMQYWLDSNNPDENEKAVVMEIIVDNMEPKNWPGENPKSTENQHEII